MEGFIASVDARTQLAGRNRMELLLFRITGKQRFGINVFKVREVIQCPQLTPLPDSNKAVRGLVNIRGKTMAVLDLGCAIGLPPITKDEAGFLVVTEFNASVQGFLVSSVDRIVNQNWQEILPPPKSDGGMGYLTAVTHVDEELVGIIDIERVLAEVMGAPTDVSESYQEERQAENKFVLIVDDSVVARKQMRRTLEQIGCEVAQACDGEEALALLTSWQHDNSPEYQKLGLIISDIEMPRMDGYTLTSTIRKTEGLKDFKIILHTSLSGGFNRAMVEKVGANEFLAKFEPDLLADAAIRNLGLELAQTTNTSELESKPGS